MSRRNRDASQGMMPEFELQLGSVCNNRCNFCSSGQDTELGQAGIMPLEQVRHTLDHAYERGFRKITFLGGEPTLYKTFMPSLKYAVERGFDECVIFTNGVKARNAWWIEEAVALGEFTWRFSIQGGDEAAHDKVTGRKGSFARIVQALEHLAERPGQRLTANMCVNEHSYRSLPELPMLANRLKLTQMCVDMVRPISTGERSDDYLEGIIPRYDDMAPYIEQMLQGFVQDAPECEINLTNFPYCHLPGWAHVMSHGGESTATNTVAGGEGGDVEHFEMDKYSYQASGRDHPDGCDGCVFTPICAGVPHKYVELYGADEFRAVSRRDLDQLDEGARANLFSLLVRPAIEPILAIEPPDSWVLAPPSGNNRDRRVDVRCVHPEGSVFLGFSSPGASSDQLLQWAPILETDQFDLRIMLTQESEAAPIESLAAWVQDVLSRSGATVHRRAVWRRPSGRRGAQRGRAEKALELMQAMVSTLAASGPMAGWSPGETALSPEQASVEFCDGAGAVLRVVLEPGLGRGARLVEARFEFGDLPMDVIRPPLEAISDVLRAATRADQKTQRRDVELATR